MSNHSTQSVRLFIAFWCFFAFISLTGCSDFSNVDEGDDLELLISFEALQHSHPLVTNAWVRNDIAADGFIEFDMEYRLEKLTDDGWECLPYVNPPNFPDRIVRLYAGEWSNAYVQSWYLTHGELAFGEYRIWKTFRYYSERNEVSYHELYSTFSVSDVNDASVWIGEVVRYHTATELDVENSLGLLYKGMPVLLTRIENRELATSYLFALWLDAALVVDAFGDVLPFDEIPAGANIYIIGFGHLGLDGVIDGDIIEHMRNVRFVRLTG